MAPCPSAEGPSSRWRGPPESKSQTLEKESKEAKHERCPTGTERLVLEAWGHP